MPPPPGYRMYSDEGFYRFFPSFLFPRRSPPRSARRAPTNSSNSQHRTRNQLQTPTQTTAPSSHQIPMQTTTPSSDQNRIPAENEQPNAQAAVLINMFHAKTRPPVASELENDMSCTLCSEVFLCGSNPEVPVRLDCGHIFGMGCLLKWLSPVSRNGKNSCPNCRLPVFDDCDKSQPASATRRMTSSSTQTNSQINSTSSRPSPLTMSTADASRGERGGLTPSSSFPSGNRVPEASDWLQAVEEPQAFFEPHMAVSSETRTLVETSTPHDSGISQPRPLRLHVGWDRAHLGHGLEEYAAAERRFIATTRESLRQLESVRNHHNGQIAVPTPAPPPPSEDEENIDDVVAAVSTPNIPTPAPARPSGDEESINGVAAMFNAAETEHVQQRQQRQQAFTHERKRYMWMQFREGVVHAIEISNDSTAFTNHDLALTIINMKDVDEYIAERTARSAIWRRTLNTFTSLHSNLVTRLNDFRPLPSVDVNHLMELERLLASTRFDRETLHRSCWHVRLSERLATVARSAERVADLSWAIS